MVFSCRVWGAAAAAPLPVGETGGSKGKKKLGRFAAEKRKVHSSAKKNKKRHESRFSDVKAVIFLASRGAGAP
jgi:hypothetical protein